MAAGKDRAWSPTSIVLSLDSHPAVRWWSLSQSLGSVGSGGVFEKKIIQYVIQNVGYLHDIYQLWTSTTLFFWWVRFIPSLWRMVAALPVLSTTGCLWWACLHPWQQAPAAVSACENQPPNQQGLLYAPLKHHKKRVDYHHLKPQGDVQKNKRGHIANPDKFLKNSQFPG